MIIGFCGYKGSGKDAATAYLIKNFGFERRSFAAPLKASVAELLEIPVHMIEEFKNDPTVYVTIGYKNEPTDGAAAAAGVNSWWSPISELTFREFLQRYGTEAHREIFGEDFWVDQCLPLQSYSGRKIVIPDVRFENEASRVIAIGGSIVRIDRGIVNDDLHPSETIIDLIKPTAVVENLGTISDFYRNLDTVLFDLY